MKDIFLPFTGIIPEPEHIHSDKINENFLLAMVELNFG